MEAVNPIILIQVRLKSTRLPLKALRPIYGVPMIIRLVERLERLGIPLKVCTSTHPQDALLAVLCDAEEIPCYLGHPWNVAERFSEAAEDYNPIIRVTGDNPLTDPNILLDLLARWEPGSYIYPSGVPRGVKSEVIDVGLLDKIPLERQEHEFSHVLEELPHANEVNYDYDTDISLTCDTREDYDRLVRIYDYWDGKPPGLTKILGHWGKY